MKDRLDENGFEYPWYDDYPMFEIGLVVVFVVGATVGYFRLGSKLGALICGAIAAFVVYKES